MQSKATPTPKPTIPGAMASANAALGKNTTTKTPKVVVPIVGDKTVLKPIDKGVQTNWSAFTDGSLVLVTTGAGGTQVQPYISGVKPTAANPNPSPVVILPSADGTGFYQVSLDKAAQDSMVGVSASNAKSYKQQLRAYYPSEKAYKISIATNDKDLSFQEAVKRALLETSVSNFQSGANNAAAQAAGTGLPNSLYDFNSYVNSRPTYQPPSSSSSRTSGLTVHADAIAEFYRTTQQYVGDPTLVDKLPALAEAYWEKLNKTELNRGSTSTSTVDALGNQTSSGVQYAQLSDADRLEMRIGFLTKGGTSKDSKGKTIVSNGIKNATSDALQNAGGLIGDNYTKLIQHSYDMGINITHADLVARAGKALLPGGSVDEQMKSMTQASKAYYTNLTSYIDSGLKVSDIASNYQAQRDTELELAPGSTTIFDSNVQNALRADKLQDPNDFLLGIRKDPAWRYTKKANEASADFVDSILKTWGKVG